MEDSNLGEQVESQEGTGQVGDAQFDQMQNQPNEFAGVPNSSSVSQQTMTGDQPVPQDINSGQQQQAFGPNK